MVAKKVGKEQAEKDTAKCADLIAGKKGFIRSRYSVAGHCLDSDWDTLLRKIGLSRSLDQYVKAYITGTMGLAAPRRVKIG